MRSLVLCAIMMTGWIAAWGQSPSPGHDRAWVLSLYRNGLYADAASEAQGCILAGDPLPWNFFRGVSLYMAGDYRAARAAATGEDGADVSRRILRGMCSLRMGLPRQALDDMNTAMPALRDDAWRLTLCRVDAFLDAGDYGRAMEDVLRYRNAFGDPKADSLYGSLAGYSRVDTVSPGTAAALSALLPGAGQVYARRWKDGTLSFLAVAGAAGLSVLAFMHGYNDLGGTFAFFSGLFYGGTVYGAWNSARRTNADLWKTFNRDLRDKHITPYDPETDLRRHGFMR